MKQATILLLEGKRTGNGGSLHTLQKAGHTVVLFHTGTKAVTYLDDECPQLSIVNAATMRSSGARTCRRFRKVRPDVPLIHIRGEGEEKDEECAADEYLQLPFTPRKLMNRVKSLLPADVLSEEVVRYGPITFFRTKRSVELNGRGETKLTPKLAHLLEEFLRHPNELVTRKQLMIDVWKTDYVGDTRTLDVHIRWIREILEEDPTHPKLLMTVRGRGYRLTV